MTSFGYLLQIHRYLKSINKFNPVEYDKIQITSALTLLSPVSKQRKAQPIYKNHKYMSMAQCKIIVTPCTPL